MKTDGGGLSACLSEMAVQAGDRHHVITPGSKKQEVGALGDCVVPGLCLGPRCDISHDYSVSYTLTCLDYWRGKYFGKVGHMGSFPEFSISFETFQNIIMRYKTH